MEQVGVRVRFASLHYNHLLNQFLRSIQEENYDVCKLLLPELLPILNRIPSLFLHVLTQLLIIH